MTIYLVTGGAGFIGSHITEHLVCSGNKVRVIDNLETGFYENIQHLSDQIDFIQGDIADPDVISKAMTGVDYVLHQAAVPSVPRSVSDPRKSNNSNICGTLEVLLAARDAGVKRVVFASSSSVYGADPTIPKVESQGCNPKSPYALSKLTGEMYCRIFTDLYGLETVCLRYFNVFGPRQSMNSQYAAVIPNFVRALKHRQSPLIFSDGEQSRDFTYVENVVQANLLACIAENVAGESFNIGCGSRITVNQLLAVISRLMNIFQRPLYQPARPGDVRHSLASIEKARQLLGYQPLIDIDEGLARTVSSFLQ